MSRRRAGLEPLPDDLDDYKDICAKQAQEIEALRHQIDEKQSSIYEMKYKTNKAMEENKDLKEKLRVAVRNEESISALHRQTVERYTLEKETKKGHIASFCNDALVSLSGLERHSQFGNHLVASRTTVSLLLQVRKAINSITEINDSDDDGSGISSPSDASSREEKRTESFTQAAPSALESELLELCQNLEVENRRLRSDIKEVQKDLEAAKKQGSLVQLIPYYRNEIIRAREESNFFRQELKKRKERSRAGEFKNEDVNVKENEEDMRQDRKIGIELKRDPHSRSVNACKASAPSNNFRSKVCDTEADLVNLDTDIEGLRRQLEKAALSQTQKLIREVMHNLQVEE